MVNNVTSFTGNGLRDWLIQRVTAVILGAFSIFLLVFFMLHHPMDYSTWRNLFSQQWMKIFTLLTIGSLGMHAWVGIWTVLTDYIKPACLRLLLEVLVILALIVYVIWGFNIFWSV